MSPTAPIPVDGRPELDPDRPGDALILVGLHRQCVPVFEGVLAYVEPRNIAVPSSPLIVRGVLAADPRVPGAVGRWLDTLPYDRKVLVPAVVSGRLAGMLERRGFRPTLWYDAAVGEFDNAALAREPA